MRKRVALGLILLVFAFGAASWLAPATLERLVGRDLVVFTQAVGVPAFWALSAGLNVAIMAAILGLLVLAGWLFTRRAR